MYKLQCTSKEIKSRPDVSTFSAIIDIRLFINYCLSLLADTIKNTKYKNYNTIGIISKSNQRIVERVAKSIPLTHIHIILLTHIHTIPLAHIHTILLAHIHTILLTHIHTIPLTHIHTIPLTHIHTIPLTHIHTIPLTHIHTILLTHIHTIWFDLLLLSIKPTIFYLHCANN